MSLWPREAGRCSILIRRQPASGSQVPTITLKITDVEVLTAMATGMICKSMPLDLTPTLTFVLKMRKLVSSSIIMLTLAVGMVSEYSII